MTHYSEHTLELLVLNSPKVEAQRQEILDHLKDCKGCSDLYEEVREFYGALSGPQGLPEHGGEKGESLKLHPHYESSGAMARNHGDRGAISVWIADNPRVARTIGTVALLGALVAIVTLWRGGGAVGDPSYYALNTAQNLIEVYNSSDEKLWHVPVLDATAIGQSIATEQYSHTLALADIDGNGQKELLVVAQRPGEGNAVRSSFTIYDADRSVRTNIVDLQQVSFDGIDYPEPFAAASFNVSSADSGGKRDVYVVMTNGRSPCVLLKLDYTGAITAQYWHFGNLLGPYMVDLNDDGHEEVLLSGSIDAGERTHGLMAVRGILIALDTKKLKGTTESSVTRGFGYASSTAEFAMLRTPATRPDSLLGIGLRMGALRAMNAESLVFQVNGYPKAEGADFDYTFDRGLRVKELRASDMMYDAYREGHQTGLLPESLTVERALETYRNVEYWDGKVWKLSRVNLSGP